ncbi:MAG: hypothetical protein U0527_04980 [Candidatus Eisenbacteria bacterium]
MLLISPRVEASWTITGTATREDGITGLTGVKVVIYPGELATISDDNGDFILRGTAPGIPRCRWMARLLQAARPLVQGEDRRRLHHGPGRDHPR